MEVIPRSNFLKVSEKLTYYFRYHRWESVHTSLVWLAILVGGSFSLLSLVLFYFYFFHRKSNCVSTPLFSITISTGVRTHWT